MTGLDFIKIKDREEVEEVLHESIISFVDQGYMNIPDWISLSEAMAALIRKHGWSEKDIEEIALKAAIALGMKKKE